MLPSSTECHSGDDVQGMMATPAWLRSKLECVVLPLPLAWTDSWCLVVSDFQNWCILNVFRYFFTKSRVCHCSCLSFSPKHWFTTNDRDQCLFFRLLRLFLKSMQMNKVSVEDCQLYFLSELRTKDRTDTVWDFVSSTDSVSISCN